MTSEFTKSVIALACWRAAKDELHSVMLSVCQVFQNRANAGWYHGDIYENAVAWLIEHPGEFPDTRDPQFQQMLAKIENVLSGQIADKTGGAIWFVRKQDLPEKLEGSITATIGGLIFVR